MEGIKIENLQTFFKSVGLEDNDFNKLAKEDIEDFTPFVEKAKAGIKEVLMADSTFLDEITRPYKDAQIGKEKQLKKEARKFFNLQIKEDDLTKMQLSEILTQGTSALKNADNSEVEKFRNSYTELLEENEKLKNEIIPAKIAEVENQYKTKIQQKDINEELIGLVSTETAVPKENIPYVSTAFRGFVSELGYSISIDDKKTLSLKDKDGMPPKKEDGGLLKVKDVLKDFITKMTVNIAPKGIVTNPITKDGTEIKRSYNPSLEKLGSAYKG